MEEDYKFYGDLNLETVTGSMYEPAGLLVASVEGLRSAGYLGLVVKISGTHGAGKTSCAKEAVKMFNDYVERQGIENIKIVFFDTLRSTEWGKADLCLFKGDKVYPPEQWKFVLDRMIKAVSEPSEMMFLERILQEVRNTVVLHSPADFRALCFAISMALGDLKLLSEFASDSLISKESFRIALVDRSLLDAEILERARGADPEVIQRVGIILKKIIMERFGDLGSIAGQQFVYNIEVEEAVARDKAKDAVTPGSSWKDERFRREISNMYATVSIYHNAVCADTTYPQAHFDVGNTALQNEQIKRQAEILIVALYSKLNELYQSPLKQVEDNSDRLDEFWKLLSLFGYSPNDFPFIE